ncbi:diguanylate cyclase (GGDEF) domain-containing protein [Fibrobacter sp. UWH9]|uniref:GGDEF domain-containing protein n=1 Tax=Fibrobacter sp. UWH9 TaxID=1896213 RepID=UPI00090EF861|nr:GGDEF domain-containing protein [Fibrobacter sp. UWH9]SHH31354.1 diguanylate cyclase (GGDEF) domain-containing protein [Fibrobacter sp. UWH9]
MFQERLDEFLRKQDTLENVFFWVTLGLVGLASFMSAVSSVVEKLPGSTVTFCFFCFLCVVLLGVLAKITQKISFCYVALCLLMCGIILPLQFFMYGALNSSIIIYFFGSVFLCALHEKRATRYMLIAFAIVSGEASFVVSWLHPEWVTNIDAETTFIDYCATYLVLSICLGATTSYLLKLYALNQKDKDELLEKLRYLAEKDPLTDLYNRRHFIDYLSKTVWHDRKDGYYVFMYDIDNFKEINDTYGHPFGDMVLRGVATIGRSVEDACKGECAVRYGGEEFIQLIRASSMEMAFAKAEYIRTQVRGIAYADKPEMVISISGGLVCCGDEAFESQNKILSGVDALLYKAKANGKNQICKE